MIGKNFLFAFSMIPIIFYIAFAFIPLSMFFVGWRILVCLIWSFLVQKLSIPLVILNYFLSTISNATVSIIETEGWELVAVCKLQIFKQVPQGFVQWHDVAFRFVLYCFSDIS